MKALLISDVQNIVNLDELTDEESASESDNEVENSTVSERTEESNSEGDSSEVLYVYHLLERKKNYDTKMVLK